MPDHEPLPLYQVLADRLALLIAGGTFTAGARLPSVRRMSRDQRVSVTTVLEAYGRLEDQGIIESRPRSGYYVRPPQVLSRDLPRAVRRSAKPVVVKHSGIFETVMDAVAQTDVVPFGLAVPADDIMPAAKLASMTNGVIRRHGAAAFRYTMAPGRRELRVALSRRCLSGGIEVPPEWILVTQGATEAIALALRATTRRGDLVAVESPTYFGILQLAKDLGLQVLEIPVDAATGFDVATFRSMLEKFPVAACIVQPSYQNPVGSCMSDESKIELVELANRHDFMIIEDDLYGDISHREGRPTTVSYFDRNHRVIHCSSFSKVLSPGLRVGWVANSRYFDEMKRLKAIHYLANPTVSELVVAEFLEAGGYDRHLRRIRSLFDERCRAMREAVLEAFPVGTRVNQPAGGFVIWVEMAEGFDSEEFAVKAIAEGISLVPGTIFTPSCRLRNCFRLSCGAAFDERSAKAVRTLGRLAEQCFV